MPNLWTLNTPPRFWQSSAHLTDAQWDEAVQRAAPFLGLARGRGDEGLGYEGREYKGPGYRPWDVEELLALTLGEGRFGPDRWRLSPAKQAYYVVKPLLPRALTRVLRRIYGRRPHAVRLEDWKAGRLEEESPANLPTFHPSTPHWPADTRYAEFQWAVMRHLVSASGKEALPFTYFWPSTPPLPPPRGGGEGSPGGGGESGPRGGGESGPGVQRNRVFDKNLVSGRFAFVLTHDVETAEGQAFVRRLADVDESYGFRSSFNLVPERYPLDYGLIDELRARGFEVGVHGLRHDGKLFRSRQEFERRAQQINHYLREWGALGFRAPLTHRHAEWMQALEVEYDLSFFDTDPYEPMPGGTMSLWPFILGRFVELPYTLVQDYTLTAVMGETTPRLWLDKVDVIEKYHGLALLNSHPDYMAAGPGLAIYREFLEQMKDRGGFWHALPRDVARWWRSRLGVLDAGPERQLDVPDTLAVEAMFHADGSITLPGEPAPRERAPRERAPRERAPRERGEEPVRDAGVSQRPGYGGQLAGERPQDLEQAAAAVEAAVEDVS